jgi:hypothetical protein
VRGVGRGRADRADRARLLLPASRRAGLQRDDPRALDRRALPGALEIFHFAAGKENPLDGEFFIGSADWMTRNLSQRVEAVAPVLSRSARERLWEILDLSLRDQRQAWIMNEKGEYTQQQPGSAEDGPEAWGVQRALIELMERRATDGQVELPVRT